MHGLLTTICILLVSTNPSPVPIIDTISKVPTNPPPLNEDYCYLYPELGFGGNLTYLEDCPSLERYAKVPMPGKPYEKLGVHPVVCCPQYIPDSTICFPSDPWCPTYDIQPAVDPTLDYDTNYEYSGDSPPQYELPASPPTMSDQSCDPDRNPNVKLIPGLNNGSASCVTLDRCPSLLVHATAPETHVVSCGFDETSLLLMLCCPHSKVEDKRETKQEPRFRNRQGKPWKCEDKTDLCRKWKENQGCRLDVDIVLSELDPLNGIVESKTLFDFMQTSCPDTCGWCRDSYCVDEHPRCVEWARLGMCVHNPLFMAHTCRESCGVCGFMSPTNKEEQIVDTNSYSDFTRHNFDCGRSKALSEINNRLGEAKVESTTTTKTTTKLIGNVVDVRSDDPIPLDVFFFSSDSQSNGEISCGATLVSDRWAVTASHCYDDFTPKQRRFINIRVGTIHVEMVEIKQVYRHPHYVYPKLYNDVAVLELGRRVQYDYDIFGDTPSCIDQGLTKEGKIATIQGFGLDEEGIKGNLLETNVTVISNKDCTNQLRNIVEERGDGGTRDLINTAIPYGLDYGFICAKGIYNKTLDRYSGACFGDSGGPVFLEDPRGKQTLIGIVSGGVDCGLGYPGWFTNVVFFQSWIQCIINQSLYFNNVQNKVKEACEAVVELEPCKENMESSRDGCKQYLPIFEKVKDVIDHIFGTR